MQMAMDDNRRQNQESDAKVRKDDASAIKALADAEAVELGKQLDIYSAELNRISETFKQQSEVVKIEQQAEQQRLSGMGQSPGNNSGAQ